MNHGTEHEGCVGASAGDDNSRASIESLRNGKGSEVDTGAPNLIPNDGQRLAGIHVDEVDAAVQQFIQTIGDVVAGNRGDGNVDAVTRGDGPDSAAASFR